MLEAAREEINRIADSVTPAESAAFMIATMHGRDCLPAELDEDLWPAAQKMVQIGWLVYTQLMAAAPPPPAKPPNCSPLGCGRRSTAPGG